MGIEQHISQVDNYSKRGRLLKLKPGDYNNLLKCNWTPFMSCLTTRQLEAPTKGRLVAK